MEDAPIPSHIAKPGADGIFGGTSVALIAFCRGDEKERVAVGRRLRNWLGADASAGTRPVLDDEWLAKPIGQPLPDQACENVRSAAGGLADDNAHRSRGIRLPAGCFRQLGKRGGANAELQHPAV